MAEKFQSNTNLKIKKLTRLDFLKLAGVAGAVGATLPSLISFGQVLGSVVLIITIPILTRRQPAHTTNQQSSSVRIFDLDGAKPQFQSVIGSRMILDADNFSILAGMGLHYFVCRKVAYANPTCTAMRLNCFIHLLGCLE